MPDYALYFLIALGTLVILFLSTCIIAGEAMLRTRRKKLKKNYGENLPLDIAAENTSDKIQLKGWFFQSKNHTKKTVIFCHGYGAYRDIKPFYLILQPLLDNGYNVLTFDFRRCGESGGKNVTAGAYEVNDLAAIIDYAVTTLKQEKIALLGYSQGANVALRLGYNDNVSALIADSAFASLYDYLKGHLHKWSHLPKILFSGPILLYLRIRARINYRELLVRDAILKYQDKPLYLIHCQDDESIPYAESQYIGGIRTNKDITTLWLPKKGGHVGACSENLEEYIQKLLNFLHKYV